MDLSPAHKNLWTVSFILYSNGNACSRAALNRITLQTRYHLVVVLYLMVIQCLFCTLSNKISLYFYGFKILLIILLLRLMTSLMPGFCLLQSDHFFQHLWLFTSLIIHHSNAFVQFSIFFTLINNCHKIFMIKFIIYQRFRYFTFCA